MIHEYKCRGCTETFIGDGAAEEEHIDCSAGEGNIGDLVYIHIFNPKDHS